MNKTEMLNKIADNRKIINYYQSQIRTMEKNIFERKCENEELKKELGVKYGTKENVLNENC